MAITFEDVAPISSSILGVDEESDRVLSELRASGEGGRPATVPTRGDLGISRREPNFLQRLGLAFSDVSAGIAGRPFPSLEFERRRREEEDRERLFQLQTIPALFSTLEKFSELDLPEEQRKAAAPEIARLFRAVGGVQFTEGFWQEVLTQPGRLDLLRTLFPRLTETLEPRQLSRLTKNEGMFKHLLEREKGLQRQTGLARIKQLRDSGMTFESEADLRAAVPEAQYLSPEDLASVGVKTGKAALAGQEAGARKGGEIEAEAGALEQIAAIEKARAKAREAGRGPTQVDLAIAAVRGDTAAAKALAALDRGSIGAFVTTLVRRSLGNDVEDADIQDLTPPQANALLGQLGRLDAIKGLLNQSLQGAFGPGGVPTPGAPAPSSPGAPVLGLGASPQGTGKAPKQSDIDVALKRAKGNKQAAAEILRKRGFDLNVPVKE